MNQGYKSLKEAAFAEYVERKSVFYSTASPVFTEEEAIDLINSVKKKYSDATHNVYAYIIRENNISRYSDDGEPHGTAGIPVLDMLRKEGLTNVAVVVTRYFGGILLGTGGLVRAYTASAKLALDKGGIVFWLPHGCLKVNASYGDYQRLAYLFKTEGVIVKDIEYTDTVRAECLTEEQKLDRIIGLIPETTGGRAEIEILPSRYLPTDKGVNANENN
ncbi:MAG: YigZ family protein [Clostridiales bacterium]|jgi:uncharacterized YigZ family protein|nr:YigZ family protein [Clostridiales bacterium]